MRLRVLLASPLLVAALSTPVAGAGDELAETVGAWIVTCGKTEAGGRECQLRNDEAGKPALEQSVLLSFTLHDGRNEADGLIRVADLELASRLPVEIAFGDQVIKTEGVGRRGRLAVRFTMQNSVLRSLADVDKVRVRFADREAVAHEVLFPLDGFGPALAIAEGYL